MKFLVLFLATAALASATFIAGKYIDIKEDGTIYIKGEDGKEIYITKSFGPYGQKNIEIEVTGPNNFAKMYQFNYNNQIRYGKGMGYPIFNTLNRNFQEESHDILDVIFREYLGYVDEYTYQQLLNKIQKAVLNGYFDGQVLYILQGLVEDPKWNSLISGQNFYGQIGGAWNKMTQQNKYGLLGKLFKTQGFYGRGYNQYNVNYYYNVLMKIFDRKVLKNVLTQGQMYNQEMYGQYSYEKMWEMIFTHEGIFDYHYLVEIINNEMLRNWFVQHGFFDKVVLDQILSAYKTEGVYDQYLLQRLFNTQVLKYFYVNHGISVYDILGQTSYNQYYDNTFYNKGIYGYTMLEKFISEPVWRNVFVQYGIFNKNVLDQILYRYNTQGVYDQELLTQLVNKQALYNFLVQYGVFDQTVLRQYVDNEYLGLNFLFKNNFFQQTPRTTFQHVLGVPEYTSNMKTYGGDYWKNFLYGQQYYGYNKGPYSYGKSYSPYALAQQVY